MVCKHFPKRVGLPKLGSAHVLALGAFKHQLKTNHGQSAYSTRGVRWCPSRLHIRVASHSSSLLDVSSCATGPREQWWRPRHVSSVWPVLLISLICIIDVPDDHSQL